MKIVVIGATGNVGTSTVRALAREQGVEEILGIARRRPALQMPKTAFVEADITRDDLVPLLKGADAVIHLAWLLQPAREALRLHRVNVQGSERVFEAAVKAGVPSLVLASSVGVYSRGPKDRRVDESWAREGIPTSLYSMQKVAVEHLLDRFEDQHPGWRVVRLRPALIFKRGAASEIRRLFMGPLVPRFLFRKDRIPFVPDVDRLRFQCLHSHDAGAAFARAAVSDVRGPFNLAAEPVLDPDQLGQVLHARLLRLPAGWLRSSVAAAWRLHLIPSDRGWIDLGLGVPLMTTDRARRELGFQPRHSATDTLLELMDGLREGAGMATEPLHGA